MSTDVTMHTTKTIQLSWNVPGNISEAHLEALDESGMERALEMVKQGYVEGELHDNIHILDTDPKDGVEYTGYWRMTSTSSVSSAGGAKSTDSGDSANV